MNPEIAGRWVYEADSYGVELMIDVVDGLPSVTALAQIDREVLDVIDLHWEDDSLKFDTVVPSSGYRGRWVMRFGRHPGTCEVEFTYWERWQRVSPDWQQDPNPQVREMAVGLQLGILDPPDLVAWADRHIMQLDTPPYWLIELSLASRACVAEMLKILPSQTPSPEPTDLEFLGAMALRLIDRGEPLATILPPLFERFCLAESTPMIAVRDEIYLVDDESDWDRAKAEARARSLLGYFLPGGRELFSRALLG